MTRVAILAQLLLAVSMVHAASRPITMYFPERPTSVEGFIAEVAAKAGTPGSLVVEGDCFANGSVAASLAHPPPGPFRSLHQALARLVQIDKDLKWTRASNGLFRVTDRRVPSDILDIRIGRFQFDKLESIETTVDQLLKDPAIEHYVTEHGIQHDIIPPGIRSMVRLRDGVALAPMMSNVSLREALDTIAKADNGIWAYSECVSDHTRRIVIQGAPI